MLFRFLWDRIPRVDGIFDTAAGKDEITARHRIGKGELAAIAACEAIADAQNRILHSKAWPRWRQGQAVRGRF